MSVPARRSARAAALSLLVALIAGLAGPATSQAQGPTTPLEAEGRLTTHDEELAFLAEVDGLSDRMRITEIGRTAEDRPLQLVTLGAPGPRDAAANREVPTLLLVCTQHGNEPAGREACLIAIRDLALDSRHEALLERTSVIVVPTANPDGRAGNSRTNTARIDINRDHVTLVSPEARAIAAVIRDSQPDLALDLHEYGPGQPVVYDDDLLYLWPRNLNVDDEVHDLSVLFGRDYVEAGGEAAGYSADEYGIAAFNETDLTQTAGDGDEGIMRNAAGLRHVLGMLVESAVSPRRAPSTEAIDSEANLRRRVASQVVVVDQALRFMDERGDEAAAATAGARQRARTDTRPVFFGGQDEDTTFDRAAVGDRSEPRAVLDPPPCGYRLTPEQRAEVGDELGLHGVRIGRDGLVSLRQAAEPMVPLLLDEEGERGVTVGERLAECPRAAPDRARRASSSSG